MSQEVKPVSGDVPGPKERKQGVTREIRGDELEQQRSPAPDGDDPDLRTQHERDQSSDAAGDEPREVIRQAKRDVDAGLIDTDLRGTPGIDAERRRELLEREKDRTAAPKRKG